MFHSFCSVDVILCNFLFGRGQLNIWFLLPSNLLVWLVPQKERETEREGVRERNSLTKMDEGLTFAFSVMLNNPYITQRTNEVVVSLDLFLCI